jgi:2-hydroxymuconate-semialdehyde hydrolase
MSVAAPFPLEMTSTRLSGGDLAYADTGEGPAVVLLHGFPTSAFLWRREAWLLAQRMRVIAPDLLGYGRSEKPLDADLTEPAQAGYVRELLDRLEVRRVALVGHGLGGVVAQLLALDAHELEVPALVLVDAPTLEGWPDDDVRGLQGTPRDRQTTAAVEGAVRRRFDLGMGHPERLTDADLHAYLQPWAADPAALFRAACAMEGKGLAGRQEDLSALDMPALLIWGEDDPFVPAEAGERLADLLPGSTLGLLPGCSHFVGEDAPQTVGPLISEYLRARYLGDRHSHAPSGPIPIFLERPPPDIEQALPDEGEDEQED